MPAFPPGLLKTKGTKRAAPLPWNRECAVVIIAVYEHEGPVDHQVKVRLIHHESGRRESRL